MTKNYEKGFTAVERIEQSLCTIKSCYVLMDSANRLRILLSPDLFAVVRQGEEVFDTQTE